MPLSANHLQRLAENNILDLATLDLPAFDTEIDGQVTPTEEQLRLQLAACRANKEDLEILQQALQRNIYQWPRISFHILKNI